MLNIQSIGYWAAIRQFLNQKRNHKMKYEGLDLISPTPRQRQNPGFVNKVRDMYKSAKMQMWAYFPDAESTTDRKSESLEQAYRKGGECELMNKKKANGRCHGRCFIDIICNVSSQNREILWLERVIDDAKMLNN